MIRKGYAPWAVENPSGHMGTALLPLVIPQDPGPWGCRLRSEVADWPSSDGRKLTVERTPQL